MGGVTQRIMLFIKHLFLGFIRCFRKIICIGRKRKQVDDSDPTSVVVMSGPSSYSIPAQSPMRSDNNQYQYSQHNQNGIAYNSSQEQDWGNWETGFENSSQQNETILTPDRTIEEKNVDEADIDFFKDMEPTVKVKRVFIKKKSAAVTTSNRLAMDRDLEFKVNNELDEWEDDEGWDGEDDDDLDIDEAKVLREAQMQRKLERQSRAKQQKTHKSTSKPHEKLALKVS